MPKFNLTEWNEIIQPRILKMGYRDIPNCKWSKIAGNFEREFHVEFNSSEDETIFVLQFGKGIV